MKDPFSKTPLVPIPKCLRVLSSIESNQKNPRVRKIRVRNSGAGNGCANLMNTWKKCVLSAGKPMSIKFCVLRGFFWGGGKCRFCFYGREDFSDPNKASAPGASPLFPLKLCELTDTITFCWEPDEGETRNI